MDDLIRQEFLKWLSYINRKTTNIREQEIQFEAFKAGYLARYTEEKKDFLPTFMPSMECHLSE